MKWCQERIGLYKGIEIKNFSSSWNDGLAFCALIHSFLPQRIDYEQLRTDNNPKKNFQVAFKIAQSLGIQQTLDIQDLLNQERPDWNAVMNYVTLIYKHFHMQSKESSSSSSTDEDNSSTATSNVVMRPTNAIKCSRSASSSPNDGLRQSNSQSALIKSANSIITLPLSLTIANSSSGNHSGGNSAESSSAFNSASSSSSSISKTVC
jgi:hypothetical protein